MRHLGTVFAALAAAALAFACARGAEGQGGEEKAVKATLLAEAAAKYREQKPKRIDDEFVGKRLKIVEAVGELKFEPAVAFLQEVLRDDSSIRVQVAAIVALGKTGTKLAVQTALSAAVIDRKETLLADALPWGLRFTTDPKAAEWLAKTGLRHADPNVRRAVAESLSRMSGTAEAYDEILKCLKEKEVSVLYELVKALGNTGDAKAMEHLLKFAESKDWRLREAVAWSLSRMPAEAAFAKLNDLVLDEDWHVQETAVFSLKKIDKKECIPVLIAALKTSHTRVAEEVRATLEKMTGKDFGLDFELWKSWWDLKGKEDPKPKAERDVSEVVTYYGIKVISDRVVFIIDTSHSMIAKEPSGTSRMDMAKDELLVTLEKLGGRTLFNIVTFSGSPLLWQKELKKATPENKKLAKEWLLTQNPFGQTCTYDTLKTVLEDVAGLDTVFFLSDGLPTAGRHVLQEKVLADVSKMNQFLKVKIHCIALLTGKYDEMGAPEEDKEILEHFMRRLAEENNGNFILRK